MGRGTDEPRWLNAAEMRAWRAYVVGKAVLDSRLHQDLQRQHQLALADYELLVRLSEAPCGQARMSILAEQVASSKSRISHQIGRMERAGTRMVGDLVVLTDAPDRGRQITVLRQRVSALTLARG